MFRLFKNLSSKNLPAKDPADFTLTDSSKRWESEDFCPHCLSTIGHDEFMSGICNSCGEQDGKYDVFPNRAVREIWNGEKWVFQYKERGNIRISEIRK
jgi:hypothetical protein